MKILLLGHKGYLGSYIKENLSVDILDGRKVYNNGKKYDYVINCIGKPNLEYCEKNHIETDYSNYKVIEDVIHHYPTFTMMKGFVLKNQKQHSNTNIVNKNN